ncbi:MAG: thiamine pyrophosphate-binding protein, partial [Ilumatobacteraceae bacterium]
MAHIDGHAGQQTVAALQQYGIDTMFTLNGGHVWPFYEAARDRGVRVIDTRHEQSAVFAAEAYAKLTRRPGLAVLTAGPGVTNTITAVKNAQMAQSPVVVLGGATGTILKGRGSLQDIDQLA